MSKKRSHTYRFSVRLKGCDVEFKDELSPGEIAYFDVTYQVADDELTSPMFFKALMDKQSEVLAETVEVLVCEIEDYDD